MTGGNSAVGGMVGGHARDSAAAAAAAKDDVSPEANLGLGLGTEADDGGWPALRPTRDAPTVRNALASAPAPASTSVPHSWAAVVRGGAGLGLSRKKPDSPPPITAPESGSAPSLPDITTPEGSGSTEPETRLAAAALSAPFAVAETESTAEHQIASPVPLPTVVHDTESRILQTAASLVEASSLQVHNTDTVAEALAPLAPANPVPPGHVASRTPPHLHDSVHDQQPQNPTPNPGARRFTAYEAASRAINRGYPSPGRRAYLARARPPPPPPRYQRTTPTRTVLNNPGPSTPTSASPLDRPNDTEEQKEKIAKIMSAFDDVGGSFDTIEWGRNEPQAHRGDSPETLVVPPQPVESYTTVGSLRPAVAQQFTAPNRMNHNAAAARRGQGGSRNHGHESQLGGRPMSQQHKPGYGSSIYPQHGDMSYSTFASTSQQSSGPPMMRPYPPVNLSESSVQRASFESKSQPDASISSSSFVMPGDERSSSMPSSYGLMSRPTSSVQSSSGSMNHPGSSLPSSYGSMMQPHHDLASHSSFEFAAQPQHGNISQSQFGTADRSESRSTAVPGSARNRHNEQVAQQNQISYRPVSEASFGSIYNAEAGNVPSFSTLAGNEKDAPRASGQSETSMHSSNLSRQEYNTMPSYDPTLNPRAAIFDHQGQLRRSGFSANYQHHSLPMAEAAGSLQPQVNPLEQSFRGTASERPPVNLSHVAMPGGVQASQQPVLNAGGMTDQSVRTNTSISQRNVSNDPKDKGDLDHTYVFPPPGLSHQMQPNQSGSGVHHQAPLHFTSQGQFIANQRQQVRSGPPAPLTAGPPGLRQNIGSSFHGVPSIQANRTGPTLPNAQQPPVLPANSPWLPHSRNNMFRSVADERSRIIDTLPPDEVRQYYPNGFPADMTGQYTRRPGLVVEDRPNMSEEEIRIAETNRWFHSGLKNLDKTANDHIADMALRNQMLDSGAHSQLPEVLSEYGGPSMLRGLVERSEPLSVENIQAMAITDVSARLLGTVFGNTLRIADQRPGPSNRAILSRYAPGAPWTIDDTPQGNQSFFGEDTGPTPRRVGRDPRYQPFQ